MNRLREIQLAIDEVDGFTFQTIVLQVATEELYPSLNPSAFGGDLGEDAVIETVIANSDQAVGIAVSKQATIGKIRTDCEKRRQTGKKTHTVDFFTWKAPQRKTIEQWKRIILEEFGWKLIVHGKPWLLPRLEKEEFASLLDDHLAVPPPGGNFVSQIEASFAANNTSVRRGLISTLPSINRSVTRPEVKQISEFLKTGTSVVLSGEAGSGKSGIIGQLCEKAEPSHCTLVMDARRFAHVKDRGELRQAFGLSSPLDDAVRRLGRKHGQARLIIDQFDSLCGSAALDVLRELVVACAEDEVVVVVVVCREWELQNETQLQRLLSQINFEKVSSEPPSSQTISQILESVGIEQPSEELLRISRNFLNLSLIVQLASEYTDISFSSIKEELQLWDLYRRSIEERETDSKDLQLGEKIVARAIALARTSLHNPSPLRLSYPKVREETRLTSLGIIYPDDDSGYRFRHEELRAYFYAWDAVTHRGLMPENLVNEIDASQSRDVVKWMIRLYNQRAPSQAAEFIRSLAGM